MGYYQDELKKYENTALDKLQQNILLFVETSKLLTLKIYE